MLTKTCLTGGRPAAACGTVDADDAGAAVVAGDVEPEAIDQIEGEIGCAAGEIRHRPARLGAKLRHEFIGVVFQAGNDLPAIAPRRAPARFLRLDQRDVGALFGQMQRGAEAEITTADDGDIGAGGLAQRRRRWRGGRRGGPERGRKRKGFGHAHSRLQRAASRSLISHSLAASCIFCAAAEVATILRREKYSPVTPATSGEDAR